jgi:hypothetical protein
MTPNDSSELHNKPLKATVTVKPASGEYRAQNEIKAYKSRHAGPAAQPAPAATQPAETAEATPW